MMALSPVIPVIGGDTKFQPVFVADVADAVTAVLSDPAQHAGQTYELGGPEQISMGELNQRIADMTGRERMFVDVPDVAARMLARFTGFLPGAPITSDQYKMLQKDNVVAKGAKGLEALGVAPTPLAIVARGWMEPYTEHGRFGTRAKAG
jgi:NADH dehydrogenase